MEKFVRFSSMKTIMNPNDKYNYYSVDSHKELTKEGTITNNLTTPKHSSNTVGYSPYNLQAKRTNSNKMMKMSSHKRESVVDMDAVLGAEGLDKINEQEEEELQDQENKNIEDLMDESNNYHVQEET